MSANFRLLFRYFYVILPGIKKKNCHKNYIRWKQIKTPRPSWIDQTLVLKIHSKVLKFILTFNPHIYSMDISDDKESVRFRWDFNAVDDFLLTNEIINLQPRKFFPSISHFCFSDGTSYPPCRMTNDVLVCENSHQTRHGDDWTLHRVYNRVHFQVKVMKLPIKTTNFGVFIIFCIHSLSFGKTAYTFFKTLYFMWLNISFFTRNDFVFWLKLTVWFANIDGSTNFNVLPPVSRYRFMWYLLDLSRNVYIIGSYSSGALRNICHFLWIEWMLSKDRSSISGVSRRHRKCGDDWYQAPSNSMFCEEI